MTGQSPLPTLHTLIEQTRQDTEISGKRTGIIPDYSGNPDSNKPSRAAFAYD